MANSGYVLAGFETLATILINFATRDTKERFNDNFTPQQISTFLKTTCHGFLHSFGQNFTGKKKFNKYIASEARMYDICRDSGFFDGCTFITDSGGFQASVGRINENETDILIELYHEFLVEKVNLYDRAFVLDLPPGPGCKLFTNFDDIYEKNLETYTLAKNLPDEARNKMIYINHFRTPKLWNIYEDILNEPGMFEAFNYFGTGGIVANMASDTAIPCIIYVLPLIPLLKKCIETGRKDLKFHVLGGAGFRDVLFYELFQKLVKEKHGIELEISYDSSGLFKGFMIGRFLFIIDENNVIRKIDIRSANLDKRYLKDKKVKDIYADEIHKLADNNNIKRISMNEVYQPNGGTFYEEVKVYSMMHALNSYADVQQLMKNYSNDIYPLYESGMYEEFNTSIKGITQNINGGKITRKQKAKSNSVINSLKMLETLDIDYCKYIVDKHLAKDEFTELDRKTKMLTF